MNLIPQQVRDRFGTLLDPLALLLIRWHVRPNLITTVGTLVVVGSAAAFALGDVRWGGWLLLVAGTFGLGGGGGARPCGARTTVGGGSRSTPPRAGAAGAWSAGSPPPLRGGGLRARAAARRAAR